jgi:hypothetical protein
LFGSIPGLIEERADGVPQRAIIVDDKHMPGGSYGGHLRAPRLLMGAVYAQSLRS